jgi:hypothetical protein
MADPKDTAPTTTTTTSTTTKDTDQTQQTQPTATTPANPGTSTVVTAASPTGSFPGGKRTEVQDADVPVEKRDEVPLEAKRLARKHPTCPLCDRELDVYQGTNEHKQGTGVCPTHGRQEAKVS